MISFDLRKVVHVPQWQTYLCKGYSDWLFNLVALILSNFTSTRCFISNYVQRDECITHRVENVFQRDEYVVHRDENGIQRGKNAIQRGERGVLPR